MKKIVLIAISILMFNCSKDDSENPKTNSNSQSVEEGDCKINIPFIKKGNTWKFQMKKNGTIESNYTLKLKQCNEDGTGMLLERTKTTIDPQTTTVATDLWTQDGDFLAVDAKNDGDYFAKTYKKNAKLNDIWTHKKADGATVTHEVISVDSTITVPAGTFTCKVFKYTSDSTINESFIFWNDEIGQIKEYAKLFYEVSLELAFYEKN